MLILSFLYSYSFLTADEKNIIYLLYKTCELAQLLTKKKKIIQHNKSPESETLTPRFQKLPSKWWKNFNITISTTNLKSLTRFFSYLNIYSHSFTSKSPPRKLPLNVHTKFYSIRKKLYQINIYDNFLIQLLFSTVIFSTILFSFINM